MSTVREEDKQRSQAGSLETVHGSSSTGKSSVFHLGREWTPLSSGSGSSTIKVPSTVEASQAIIARYLNLKPDEISGQIDSLMEIFDLDALDVKVLSEPSSGHIQAHELENKLHLLASTISRQIEVRKYTGVDAEVALRADLYVRNLLKAVSDTQADGITKVVFGNTKHAIELTIDAKRKIVIFKKGFDEVIGRGASKVAVAARSYFSGKNLAVLKRNSDINPQITSQTSPSPSSPLPGLQAKQPPSPHEGYGVFSPPTEEPMAQLLQAKQPPSPHEGYGVFSPPTEEPMAQPLQAKQPPSPHEGYGVFSPPTEESNTQYLQTENNDEEAYSAFNGNPAQGLSPVAVDLNVPNSFSPPHKYVPYTPSPRPEESFSDLLIKTEKDVTPTKPNDSSPAAREHRFRRELYFNQLFAGIPGLAHSILVDADSKQMYQEQMPDLTQLMQEPLNHTEELLHLVHGAVLGLCYLHANNYVHRDIKPENILQYNGLGVLSDFESVCSLDEDREMACTWSTVDYMAPEMIRSNLASKATDIWALGMVLYQMSGNRLLAHPAINGKTGLDLVRQLRLLPETGRQRYEQAYPEPTDPQSLEHLAWECTQIDPQKRPSVDELYQKLATLLSNS